MNKVSVIVPVYNAEKHLQKCIDSILNQDYKNLELLLINDGSSDLSLDILKKYEKQHGHIKVFTHDNHGVSFTRNEGLKHASGEFILFVDADDTIDPDYLHTLVSEIGDCDVVVSGYQRVTEDGKTISKFRLNNSSWAKYRLPSVCGKMYRRAFIVLKGITYSEFKIGEDMLFYMSILSRTNKVKTIDYIGYNYLFNIDSATNTIQNTKNDILPILIEIEKEVNRTILDPTLIKWFYLKTILFNLHLQRKNLTVDMMYRDFKEAKKWLNSIEGKMLFFNTNCETVEVKVLLNAVFLLDKIKLSKIIFYLLKRT